MSQEKPYPSINQYLQESGQSVNDLLAGTNFFGYPAVEDLARTAIEKKQNIEFYYASDEDLKADKLSYRFIARKAP
jgi:hypothetical protein